MHRVNMRGVLTVITLACLIGFRPCPAREPPAAGEARAIGEEAYLYGFPMIVGYDVLYKYLARRRNLWVD
jgi:hypothetical protein